MMKNLDLVRILCRSETDANLRTQDGYTPYMLCCSNGCYECADFIISRGGDPYLLSNNRQTCLSILATAIRQSTSPLEYAVFASRMLEYVDQYRLDFFGDINSTNSDIATLNDLVEKAKQEGMEFPAVQEETINDYQASAYPQQQQPQQGYESYPQQPQPQQQQPQQGYESYPQVEQQQGYESYPQVEQQQSYKSYPQVEQQQSYESYPQVEQQPQQSYDAYPQVEQQQSYESFPQPEVQQGYDAYQQPEVQQGYDAYQQQGTADSII